MQRCIRCGLITFAGEYEKYCNLCGHWLEERAGEVHDEQQALSWAEVCSWAFSGSLPVEPERKWWVGVRDDL